MSSSAANYIRELRAEVAARRERFFLHRDPGNLTPAEKRAFQMENTAHLMLLQAAQMRLDAELELQGLLAAERAAHSRKEDFA